MQIRIDAKELAEAYELLSIASFYFPGKKADEFTSILTRIRKTLSQIPGTIGGERCSFYGCDNCRDYSIDLVED